MIHFFSQKYEKIVLDFIKVKNEATATFEKEKALSKTQRIWAIKFLLETAIEHLDEKAEINDIGASKFIDLIIEGRQIENIKNSYTYKVINNFYNSSTKLETLNIIREIFLQMNLKSPLLLEKIDNKISIEKSRKNKSRI